jgi:Rhodopirellula transposase DDE domain
VHARLDTGNYPTAVQISDTQITALPITRHRFHGDWNYTLHPAAAHDPDDDGVRTTADAQPPPPAALTSPELTGMPRHRLEEMIRTLTPALATRRDQALYTRRATAAINDWL